MSKHTPDIEGLKGFAGTVDRVLTPFFAGRMTEFARVDERIDQVRNRISEPEPAAGVSLLVTGAPGAGKTSLLSKLRQVWQSQRDQAPVAISATIRQLSDDALFYETVCQQIDHPCHRRALARASGLSAVSIAGFGLSFREPAGASQEIPDAGRPIVLFVDEIQNLPTSREHPAAVRLNELQQGTHGFPVIPVLAGLSDSLDVLQQAGLSRLDAGSVLWLERLTADETAQSVAAFFDRFRVIGSDGLRNEWTSAAIRYSDGWPMHVHNALRSLSSALAEAGGSLHDVDRRAVRHATAPLRSAYYGQRTSGPLGFSPILLGRVMAAIGPDGCSRDQCVGLIETHARPSGSVGERIPEGLTASGMFQEMHRKGLLQQHSAYDEDFKCPIPSLRSWCMATAGERLHLGILRGREESVAEAVARGDNLNAADAAGRTPLQLAIEERWPQLASDLVRAGADPDQADHFGLTPRRLASDVAASNSAAKAVQNLLEEVAAENSPYGNSDPVPSPSPFD